MTMYLTRAGREFTPEMVREAVLYFLEVMNVSNYLLIKLEELEAVFEANDEPEPFSKRYIDSVRVLAVQAQNEYEHYAGYKIGFD